LDTFGEFHCHVSLQGYKFDHATHAQLQFEWRSSKQVQIKRYCDSVVSNQGANTINYFLLIW